MREQPDPSWIDRLVRRVRPRQMPPRLLDGYARRVIERLNEPAAPTLWWRLPAVRFGLPALAAAACALLWVTTAVRAPRLQRTLTQATVLEELNEPVEPVEEDGLVEEAALLDQFVLVQATVAPAWTAASLTELLDALGEEVLPEGATDDDWPESVGPEGTQVSGHSSALAALV